MVQLRFTVDKQNGTLRSFLMLLLQLKGKEKTLLGMIHLRSGSVFLDRTLPNNMKLHLVKQSLVMTIFCQRTG